MSQTFSSVAEPPSYILEITAEKNLSMTRRWFWLSVTALLGAGIFSVLLVLARTPVIGELIPYADFFHTALVIHVNLSVLVWILSFAGILWSIEARPGLIGLNQVIFVGIALATLMIAATGFLPNAKPVINNYIPVLEHPLFLTGLALFGIGFGSHAVTALTNVPSAGEITRAQHVVRFGLLCTSITVLVSLIAFAWSWIYLPLETNSNTYYELLFWGGGHILQYTYVLLMMVCWLWLISVARVPMMMSERVLIVIFIAGVIPVLYAPYVYLSYHITHPMHQQLFTLLMKYSGSLATLPLGLVVYIGLLRRKPEGDIQACAHAALISSLLLFGAGGLIGFMIQGNDVTVPAHYHGSIVGVTLALMGVGYDLLPRLGYPAVNFRLAKIQLWSYAGGQFLHILGLVWSGGYGVERKVAGAEQGLDTFGRVAGMGLMGLGGLISAIGGLLFIIIAFKALMASRSKNLNQGN